MPQCTRAFTTVYITEAMEKLETEDTECDQSTFKEKFSNFYQKHKFPITLEPLLFFYSLAYGLSEVNSDVEI